MNGGVPPMLGPANGPPPGTAAARAALEQRFVALVGLLSQEKSILEDLLRRLLTATMLASAGEHRFIAAAGDEIADAEADLGAIETARAMLVADLCDLAGVDDDASLEALISHAPPSAVEPLGDLLRDLRELTKEIATAVQQGGRLVAQRLDHISGTLDRVESGNVGDPYDRWGGAATGQVPPTRFDSSA